MHAGLGLTRGTLLYHRCTLGTLLYLERDGPLLYHRCTLGTLLYLEPDGTLLYHRCTLGTLLYLEREGIGRLGFYLKSGKQVPTYLYIIKSYI